jgi:hypothetical protein
VTSLAIVILVLMLMVGAVVAYGVHHRRQRAGGILGVDRRGNLPKGRHG